MPVGSKDLDQTMLRDLVAIEASKFEERIIPPEFEQYFSTTYSTILTVEQMRDRRHQQP